MSKAKKIWFIVAASLILLGGVIFVSIMSIFKWDFSKLSTNKYDYVTHDIYEDFSNISIDIDTADVTFLPTNDSAAKVVCFETKKRPHSTRVEDGTLYIDAKKDLAWYEYIEINFKTPELTVYLPKEEYSSLIIKGNTGDIEIPNSFHYSFHFENVDISLSTGDVEYSASASRSVKISANTGDVEIKGASADSFELKTSTGKISVCESVCTDLSVTVSTGKAHISDVRCGTLTSSGDTGDISLNNVIAEESFSIERSTGDVRLDNCDAGEIFIETDTGNVTGSLLSEKIFVTQTSTGKISLPDTRSGGYCKITTSTGNIRIQYAN